VTDEQELLEIEHALANGGGDEYREHLADNAIVIVPAETLDKHQAVEAMERSPAWDEVEISEPHVREIGDEGAVLTYKFRGQRGADHAYGALMSSAYSKDDGSWKLVLHQQTPLWER
jgi:hypothetical protein